MPIPELRWLPILVGAGSYLILEELWYSLPLLRFMWRRSSADHGHRRRRSLIARAESVIYAVVLSWLIWLLLGAVHVTSFVMGMLVGAGALIATKAFSSLTYARRRGVGTRAWWIYVAYQCVALAIAGGLLTTWS